MVENFLLKQSLLVIAPAILASLVLVAGAGYQIGRWHGKQPSIAEKREKTVGAIVGAMLALLGFMLAISLSMANSNFEARRKLVVEEANAISTSCLRAGTIGGSHGTEIVRLLKHYTRLRLDFFTAGEDSKRLKTVYEQTSAVQEQIWVHASSIAQMAPTPISGLLLTSLNEVFDLATARRWILEVRVPLSVIRLLIAFSLLSMGIMAYYFGICGVRHPILCFFLFAAFTGAILLIMDLDRPRSWYVHAEQSPLVWLIEDLERQAPVVVHSR